MASSSWALQLNVLRQSLTCGGASHSIPCSDPAVVLVNGDPRCLFHAWQDIDHGAATMRHNAQTLASLRKGPSKPKAFDERLDPAPAAFLTLGGDREF